MGAAYPPVKLDLAERERDDYLKLLYQCPVAIAKLDGRGNILLMNPHGSQLLMPISQNGELENLFEIFAPYAPEVGEMAMRFTNRSGKICEEHRFLANLPAEEKTSPLIISITMQKLDFDVFIAVIADVTSTALREVAIRTSEERLHSVLDCVKEYAICTVDVNGLITSWNRAEERLEGYRTDEVMGQHIDMLAPSRSVSGSAFKKPLEIARRDGGHEFEAWRVRKDGSRYWGNCTISSLHKRGDSTLLGFSVITRDTTVSRRAEDSLRLLATTDPLTGALNRRAFFDAAKVEQSRCHRSDETMAMLLLDIDHFKSVNDTYGHDAGDVVLQLVVAEIRTQIRAIDVLGRIGGEEFALVLAPAQGLEAGAAMAERIRSRIAALVIPMGEAEIKLTVSVGVTEATGVAIDAREMLRAADGAMYEAKRNGRNRVVVALPGAMQPATSPAGGS
ncbi:MAG: GGDEF domain-containing protein [Candidatus Eremiobacteraeota bacterium]|nr:GGDEF domain-containing protein [Candidatus Eremiobacteraeota bacterium]